MRFVPQIAAQRPAGACLDRFEAGAQAERLRFVHDAERREITRLAVLRDLRLGQQFRHGFAPAGDQGVIARCRTRLRCRRFLLSCAALSCNLAASPWGKAEFREGAWGCFWSLST